MKFFLSLFFCLIATIAFAEQKDSVFETQAAAISEQVMSPFCPGLTLAACPSDKAIGLKEEIKHWLVEGYTETAVINQLEMRFGEQIHGAPKAEGVNLLVWIFPLLFLMVGLLIVIIFVKKTKQL